jgi:CheY-like chemotaxis protein
MIFRLLLISEDSQLIASVHALELRRIANGRGNNVLDLPDSSIEVTFVSSAVSALTSVEAAVETNRPFEIVVIDRECSGISDESIVQDLWRVAPRLCVIDCGSPDSGAEFQTADASLRKTVAAQSGKRFRLPRSIEGDQLTQLVDTLLDRAALRQRCSLLQTELTKMGKRLDDLEQQNQTLDDQISRSGLKRTDHSRFPVVTHHLQRRDVVDGIEERRNHGPAVRRVTIDCRSDDPVLPPERVAAGQRHLSQQMPTPSHDVSDESQLTGRVLIVDDVPGNRRLASFLLEHAGATVVQADCGQEMLELFEAAASSGQTFDSVVLHMAMQEMDGYECARQLRLRGYCGPIIAAMACSLPLDRHLCVSAGCDEFVTMPLDRNQFIRTVRRMLKAAPMTSESR